MTARDVPTSYVAMLIRHALLGSLGFVMALQAAPALLAAERYPVWISPELGIEALDQIDARLAEPFWGPDDSITMGRYELDLVTLRTVRVVGSVTPFPVTTCQEYLDAISQGYEAYGETGRDETVYFAVLEDCRDIERLKDARPAERSFVRDFVLDEVAPDVLPATMSMPVNCESSLAAYQAHQGGQSWAAYARHIYAPLEVEPAFLAEHPDQTRYFQHIYVERAFAPEVEPSHLLNQLRTPYWSRYESGWSTDTVSILARADFDGDGLEDLMIKMVSGARGGSLVIHHTFFVTRDSATAVMRDLNAEAMVCEDDRRMIDKGRRPDGGDHPMWLSSVLGVGSFAEIDEHLAAPFAAPLERLRLYKALPGDDLLGESPAPDTSVPPVEATNCQEAIEAVASGYVAFAPGGDALRRGPVLLQRCRDIAMLEAARPARISFLQSFVPHADAPQQLPSFFRMPRSCPAAAVAYQEHAYMGSWMSSDNPGGFERVSGLWARLSGSVNRGRPWIASAMKETPGGEARAWQLYDEVLAALPGSEGHVWYIMAETALAIAILAEADFNGDGWQDVMLSLRYREHRPGARTRVLTRILTRDLPGETLRDLSPEDWLCPQDRAALAGSIAVRRFGLR